MLCNFVSAQKADSLEAALHQAYGEERVDILLELAKKNQRKKCDKGIEYASEALEISESMGYEKGIGWAYIRLGYCHVFGKKYKSAENYSNLALQIFSELPDSLGIATSNNLLGLRFYKDKQYHKALEYHLKALSIYEALKLDQNIAASANNIGMVYRDMSNHRKALEYYLKLIPIKEKLGNKNSTAISLNNIGILYANLQENENALKYYRWSLRLREEIGNKKSISISLNNIGNILNQMERREEALEYFHRSLNIKEDLKDQKGIAITQNNLGKVYYDIGNLPKALFYYNKSLRLKEKIGNKKSSIYTLKNLGLLYRESGNYSKSEEYYLKSLNYAREINSEIQIRDIHNDLAELYRALGDHKKAFDNLVAFEIIKDSLAARENEKQIAELHALYELDKTENENNLLKTSNEIQQLQINNQKALLYFLIILSVFVIVLAIIIYNRFLVKKRLNQQLALALQELKVANATKNKFFSIIAHDIKNPFSALIGFSDLLLLEDETISKNERKSIVYEINKSSQRIYSLFDNLLNWALSQRNKIVIDKEIHNLRHIVNETIQFYAIMAKQKEIEISNQVDEKLFIEADKNTMSVITANLVNNALKFTPKGGRLDISAYTEDQFVKISFKDTGIGLSESQLKNLFILDEHVRTGTDNESGTGLGLVLCKEFVEMNGGTIEAESTINAGTNFIISLPSMN